MRVANGQMKPVKGYGVVDVELNHVNARNLSIYVVEGYFPSLFGLPWINPFCREDWLQKALPSGVSSACSIEVKTGSDNSSEGSRSLPGYQSVCVNRSPAKPV